MSEIDLRRAFELIEANRERSNFEGHKTESLISLAEAALGFKFPPTYRQFLSAYGCGDIAGHEFYGIINSEFNSSGIPDGVWLTLEERESSGLPHGYMLIYAQGDGTYYAIDCGNPGVNRECKVVAWEPGASISDPDREVIAEDYGQFMLDTLQSTLS